MKRVLRPNSRFLKFEGRKMSWMSWQQLQTDDKKPFRHQNTAKIVTNPPQTTDLYLGNSPCRPRFKVNHVRVKIPGVPPGRAKLAKAPPPRLTRLQMPRGCPGGLGAGGIDWCITIHCDPLNPSFQIPRMKLIIIIILRIFYKNNHMRIKRYVLYFFSIQLHNQRPSTNSTCVLFSRGHGYVAIDVKNSISQNQWIGFALVWSARNEIPWYCKGYPRMIIYISIASNDWLVRHLLICLSRDVCTYCRYLKIRLCYHHH